ncbi:MAG TPA: HesA/MoeB/ThiF family protein [Bacteroidia bacterium]|jgi:molybdopterin/thiamine biosynthesis adenylyltransferase/rhodanese-related sulfurtransferase|nr:HesA/MoeB/ThiF family protein [Bacteroidia bacterium]
MLSKEEKERYSRHLILEGFGEEAQLKLKNAKVLVVGAGGLGCPALLYLSAAGVGTIGIIDDDIVSESNLQRQILFSIEDVGKQKVLSAKAKLNSQNPFIQIETYFKRINAENACDIIKNYDLVLDSSDNFATRYLLNDACVILNKPLVYGSIYKFEGQVSVFNYKNGPTYRCLFPEPPNEGEMPACGEVGVLGVLPGITGTWQATEAIKIITEIGEPLSGKLLRFELLSNSISTFEFEADEKNKLISKLGEYDFNCEINSVSLDKLKDLEKKETIQLVDVRDKNEFETKNLKGINIPVSEIKTRITELNPNLKTVVHCKSGVRSKQAIEIIKGYYPEIEIYNLTDYNL